MPFGDGTGPIGSTGAGRRMGRGFGLGICRFGCRNNILFSRNNISEEEYLKREKQLLKEQLARVETRLGEKE